MRLIAFFCLIWVFAISVSAQEDPMSIEGTITDPANLPIINVQVILSSPTRNFLPNVTTTDSTGHYRFTYVPLGEYLLRATYLAAKGENVVVESIVRRELGKPCVVNFTMSARGPIRETVNISASVRQPLEEISKTVDVIEGQEMRDRADFTLVDTLRTVPGFHVQQLGGFGRTASIKSRGLRNQDTAILIDGMRFRDASSITGDASAFLSDFTLTSVSRVEVLRGPGSSLYGTNAVGGTVDFQTPLPSKGWHGQVSGAAGGLGLRRFRGNISKGFGDGKFGFNAAVSRTVYTKGIDGDDDANNTNFQSRIEFNPYPKTHVSARFFRSDAFVRLNAGPDTLGTPPPSLETIIDADPGINFVSDRNDPDDSQRSKFFNGQIVLTHVINDQLVFQGSYSGLTTRRRNDSGILGPGFQSDSTSIFEGTIQTLNGHIDWTPSGWNRLTAAYEFERETFGNEGLTPAATADFFTRASQTSSTVYAQDLIRMHDGKLQFAGGFRAQFFGLGTPGFSIANAPYVNLTLDDPPSAYTFDGSASYFFSGPGTKLRMHAGSGYRVPSLYERFGTFYSTFGGNRFVPIGAPDLEPEKTAAFDAGIEQFLFDRQIRLSATYFYSRLNRTIGYRQLKQPDPFGRDNLDSGGGYLNTVGGIARGVELSGDIKTPSSTNIFVSYTYTNSDQRESQISGSGLLRTLSIPSSQFTMVVTQNFKRFWVNADFLATSSYLAPIFSSESFNSYAYRFDGNRRLDLTAGYTFPLNKDRHSLRIFGTIENVMDYEYYENGFRTVGINGRVGVSFGF